MSKSSPQEAKCCCADVGDAQGRRSFCLSALGLGMGAAALATPIYAGARKKIAQAIVDGRPLVIGGGQVRLCEHSPEDRCGMCRK